ncbi:SGNH/GDSL hydrolase family protein [Stieleria mannarensis]|uniref:SGNH/GDSL hydrolase family protein n=1 Tax=Stieleria mannarensis TaxID=2755585 RepID=UPI001600AF06|nr:SGNH/GDSL hydrolase family protein [Rhodopirellula sp. JC639]
MNPTFSRRNFLFVAAAGIATSAAPRLTFAADSSAAADSSQVQWHDVRDWGIEGRGFDDTEKYFDRLPARAKGVVRNAVWNLSRHSAGMMVRFRTDATEIQVDYAVTSSNLAMPHMPATGVSGLDLYGQDEQGNWKWVAVCKPNKQHMKTTLVQGLRPGMRDYSIYLPLYNGTESLQIGVDSTSRFEPMAPRTEKPIVFYGTSITHGACASRPGMPHPAILGRRLDRPVINLGFSGNGKLEKEVGQFLVELDPSVYVLDCLPNMVAAEITERTEPMVRQLRSAHPNVPIVLVEDRSYSGSWLLQSQATRNRTSREAFQAAYRRLLDAGTERLFYVDGESLLTDNRDDTTDGSHPSDLGFFNQANAMEPALRQALRA